MQVAHNEAILSPFLRRLERMALIGTRLLSIVGLGALMILAFITLINGLLRWLINQPIAGVADVGGLAIAIAVSCCIPIAMMERSNITIRMVSVASPFVGRLLDCVVDASVAGVLALMAMQFGNYAADVLATGERTFVLRIPVAPFWFTCGCILWIAVAVQGVIVALDIGRVIDAGKPGLRSDPSQEN